ncbi:MAG TPA: ThiF family adenylyltransferase, partial [Gemmatimonadaceae bacterium]|nr:ThiF family adenylyltransferase [Gemmatimonadaceae bacterium]
LAASGVGHVGIADDDLVDVTNLHRQLLHGTDDVGRRKIDSARATIASINPNVRVTTISARVDGRTALELVRQFDVIIDGTDNFPTRYLLNDACVLAARPLVYGSVDRFEGQVSVFGVSGGPCYRCLFPLPPEPGTIQNCADAGVLGVLPGLIGTMQATETLKLLLGIGDPLVGRLLLVDTLAMRFRSVTITPDPACPACGTHEIDALVDYETFCNPPPARSSMSDVTPDELSSLLNSARPPLVLDVREPFEWNIGRIPTAQLMPLGTLPTAAVGLTHDATVVVYCHHGQRSHAAAEILRASGFSRVRNLLGGIDRWSREVDPSVRRY